MKRFWITAVCLLLILAGASCGKREETANNRRGADTQQLHMAVLYYADDSAGEYQGWQDIYSHYEQALLANLHTESINLYGLSAVDLEPYHFVYPDISLLEAQEWVSEAIISYVEAGGSVFLENGFYDYFPKKFLGVSKFVKLEALPNSLSFPETNKDLEPMQEIIGDFAELYANYKDKEYFASLDYGYAAKLRGAKALVKQDGLALYFVNTPGQGTVFFSNPLLPNVFSVNGFALERADEEQTYFINSTASANQILRGAFAAYVAKKEYGYAAERVFGSYTAPSIAWELHYEEIEGIAGKTAIAFYDLCKQYNQIPSYSLVRNTYYWFLRAESVTYAAQKAEDAPFTYSLDPYENAYSSGTHIVSGGEWLRLEGVVDRASYFNREVTFDLRAYPCLADITGDGVTDMICGSSDGAFYFYEGVRNDTRFTVSAPAVLTDSTGGEISVPGFSAPVLLDIDGDSKPDIVSGAEDGRLYWFRAAANGHYDPMGILLTTGFGKGQVFPDAGDINGDGIPDLIVGSGQGKLAVWYGEQTESGLAFSKGENLSYVSEELGAWIAPRLVDLNGDGIPDFAAGTADGYIARYLRQNDTFVFDGYFEGEEVIYTGEKRLKFGTNAAPFFADINHDGLPDLVVGHLEYGLAYPIDSEYFPFKSELEEQIVFFEENDIFLEMHLMTHEYAAPEQEAREIAWHREAMAAYGVDADGLGTNQHTWHISKNSPYQTYLSQYDAGILWNSGAKASGSDAQVTAETVLSMPYYLMRDGEPTMLIFNTPTIPAGSNAWAEVYARYDMPICIYYHCDDIFATADAKEHVVADVAEFVKQNGYNFVSEEQLVKASAAAYNTQVSISAETDSLIFAGSAVRTDLPLYDAVYQNAAGVKISFADKFRKPAFIDADVWRWDGDSLYIGLNRAVTLSWENAENPHLTRVNLPAQITALQNGAQIAFAEGGMMQAEVWGSAKAVSEGWTVQEQEGYTLFTRYGKADTLEIVYQ